MLNRCRVIILLRIRILIFACQMQSDADPDPAYQFVADPDAFILQNDGQVNNCHLPNHSYILFVQKPD
jgi:hypothetical protein